MIKAGLDAVLRTWLMNAESARRPTIRHITFNFNAE